MPSLRPRMLCRSILDLALFREQPLKVVMDIKTVAESVESADIRAAALNQMDAVKLCRAH